MKNPLRLGKKKFKIDGLNLTDIIKSNHALEFGTPSKVPGLADTKGNSNLRSMQAFDKPTPL